MTHWLSNWTQQDPTPALSKIHHESIINPCPELFAPGTLRTRSQSGEPAHCRGDDKAMAALLLMLICGFFGRSAWTCQSWSGSALLTLRCYIGCIMAGSEGAVYSEFNQSLCLLRWKDLEMFVWVVLNCFSFKGKDRTMYAHCLLANSCHDSNSTSK